jgi:hypothetical protein
MAGDDRKLWKFPNMDRRNTGKIISIEVFLRIAKAVKKTIQDFFRGV